MRQSTCATVALFICLCLYPQAARAIPLQAGPSGTPSSPTPYVFDSMNPLEMEYNSTAGPWIKQIVVLPQPLPPEDPPVYYSTIVYTGEYLAISGTTPWSGWYEEIITENWKFLNDGQNNIGVLSAGNPPGGLSLTLNADGRSFLVDFEPLPVGAILYISFPLLYTGQPPLTLDKYPAEYLFEFKSYPIVSAAPVPEPSTFILLGAGLVGLAAVGIRRKQS